LDNSLDLGAYGVSKCDQSEEGHVLLKGGNLSWAVDVTLHIVEDLVELANAHILIRKGHGAEGLGRHLNGHNLVEDGLLVLWVQGHLLGLLLESGGVCATLVVGRAVLQYNLWSSFNIDTDGVGEEGMFNGDNRSFQFAVEGDLSENAALFLSHNFVDGNFGILEPLDEGDLGTIANWLVERVVGHLDVCLRVVDDALNDLVDDRVVKLALHQCVIARVQNEDVLSVEVNDFHFFSRHRTGLAKAEISNEANLLNGVGIANQNVIVLVHVEDAMGERKLHCHG